MLFSRERLDRALLLTANYLAQDKRCGAEGQEGKRRRLRSEATIILLRLSAYLLSSGSVEQMSERGALFLRGTAGSAWTKERMINFCRALASLLDDQKNLPEPNETCLPALALMQLYENLLRLELIEKDGQFEIMLDERPRRRHGQYYTPKQLVAQTVAQGLHRLIYRQAENENGQTNILKIEKKEEFLSLKILDPAMGAGAFLLGVIDYLAEAFLQLEVHLFSSSHDQGRQSRLNLARRLVAQHCIYGVDIDPLAVEAAKLSVWLHCSPDSDWPFSESFLGERLKLGDALISLLPARQPLSAADQKKRQAIADMVEKKAIFYWQNEFSQIFFGENAGFDAVVSNPPWEIAKPNAKEFFSKVDHNFRNLDKQRAIKLSAKLLEQNEELKQAWLAELEDYERKSAFFKFTRQTSRRAVNSAHADWNAYKLFLELGFSLLKPSGCLAMLVPSGVYTDKGAAPLRQLFFDQAELFYLKSFINRDRTFAIHSSFSYCLLALQRGGKTEEIEASFAQTGQAQANGAKKIKYERRLIETFSPKWRILLEIEDKRDLSVLKKLYENNVLLGAKGSSKEFWNLEFEREFDLTNASKLFIAFEKAKSQGYKCDQFGNWLLGKWRDLKDSVDAEQLTDQAPVVLSDDLCHYLEIERIEDVLLPLYEGRMLGQFDISQKAYRSGHGRQACWEPLASFDHKNGDDLPSWHKISKPIRPQFLLPKGAIDWSKQALKTGYLAVGSPTNVRAMISSCLYALPCGNSVPVFHLADTCSVLLLSGLLNSFVFDYLLRMRMTGNNLNFYLLEECPLPPLAMARAVPGLVKKIASLALTHVRFARQWYELSSKQSSLPASKLAIDSSERLRLRCIVDAVVAHLYGLSFEEFAWILRDTDLAKCGNESGRRAVPNGASIKGFWRVDRNLDAQLRHPVLAMVAYRDLLERGLNDFLAQADGEGWQLPTVLKLSGRSTLDCQKLTEPELMRNLANKLDAILS